VSAEQLDKGLNDVLRAVQESGKSEIVAGSLGEFVMEQLRKLDDVAYVRFASVYRSFQDLNEFRAELDRLEKESSQE